jgi:hypothetical protein
MYDYQASKAYSEFKLRNKIFRAACVGTPVSLLGHSRLGRDLFSYNPTTPVVAIKVHL